MKKFWIIVISVVLSIVLIFTCVYVYNLWQHIKYMEYCSFDLDGDEEVIFCLEDGRTYKAIPFPEGLERKDIVNTLTSMKYECIAHFEQAKYRMYRDPFQVGSEYAVFVPSPSLTELLPSPFSCVDESPFAYYVVETELSEEAQ